MDANPNGQIPSQHPRTGLLSMDGGTRFGLGVLVAADSLSMHEDPARAWGDKHGAQRPRQQAAPGDAPARAQETLCACPCGCERLTTFTVCSPCLVRCVRFVPSNLTTAR